MNSWHTTTHLAVEVLFWAQLEGVLHQESWRVGAKKTAAPAPGGLFSARSAHQVGRLGSRFWGLVLRCVASRDSLVVDSCSFRTKKPGPRGAMTPDAYRLLYYTEYCTVQASWSSLQQLVRNEDPLWFWCVVWSLWSSRRFLTGRFLPSCWP